MTGFRSVVLLALGFSLASLSGPLRAAPDNKLGMALLGAIVDGANGSLTKGSGAVSSIRNQAGSYDVTFERNITDCFAAATPILNDTAAIFVQSDKVVRVFTKDSDTGLVDSGFHLLVFCPQ